MRVMYVGVNEDICREFEDFTRANDTGVSLSRASDIGIAKAMLSEDVWDMLLLDANGCGADPGDSAAALRNAAGGDSLIVMLTDFDSDEIESKVGSSVNIYLSKPFFMPALMRAINGYIDGRRDVENADESDKLPSTGLKILVAEDNELNAELLCELLETDGSVCEIAADGEQAVERFESSEPGEFDLIFMDVQMPVMNGYEAARRIRSGTHPDAGSIVIIAMTANAFEENIRKAEEAGMNAHASKPIDIENLRRIISSLSDRKRCVSPDRSAVI